MNKVTIIFLYLLFHVEIYAFFFSIYLGIRLVGHLIGTGLAYNILLLPKNGWVNLYTPKLNIRVSVAPYPTVNIVSH